MRNNGTREPGILLFSKHIQKLEIHNSFEDLLLRVTCAVNGVPLEVVLLPELADPIVVPAAPGRVHVLVLVHAVPPQPVTVRVELHVPDVVTLDTCQRREVC